MKAWIFQDPRQVKEKGEDGASWFSGWYDPDGKRRSKSFGAGKRGHAAAEKHRAKIEAQLLTGTYEDQSKKSWKEFREEYSAKVMEGMEVGTRTQTRAALDRFEEKVKPGKVQSITSKTIADFVAKRRKDPGKLGKPISKASINKELRHLRAVLKKAHRWGYLPRMPEFDFLKESKKLPIFVSSEDFIKLYEACDVANIPSDIPNIKPADWWRALLAFAYCTGWRISELLALPWEDVDLENGTAITRADINKGKRDDIVFLDPYVIEHIAKIKAFDPNVFPWNHRKQHLYAQFDAIQAQAQVKPNGKAHYTFHDLRRGFATLNATRINPNRLQKLMRHQSYATTQRYINMAQQLNGEKDDIFIPQTKAKDIG